MKICQIGRVKSSLKNPAKIFTSIFPLIEDLKNWLYSNKDYNDKITIEPLNNKEMAEKIIKNEAVLRITEPTGLVY